MMAAVVVNEAPFNLELTGSEDVSYVDIVNDAGNGPVIHLQLNETSLADGSTAADSSGNSHTAVFHGDIESSTGPFGDTDSAIDFDSNEYVEVSPSDQFNIAEGTVQIWFNPDDLNGDQTLISRDSSGFDGGGHFNLEIKGDGSVELRLQDTNSSLNLQSTGGTVSADSWQHVAVSFGSDGAKLFVNGIEVDSDSSWTTGIEGNNEPWTLGASQIRSGNGVSDPLEQFYDGQLAEFSVHDVQFDETQINEFFEGPSTEISSDISLDENDVGAVVGSLSVEDPDVGDSHTFTVSDNRFEVVDGELKLADGESLDFETESSVNVTVTATDTGGLSTTEDFTINVNDANEGASFSVMNQTGDEDTEIPLNIDVSNLESGATHTVTINGVPNGASLSAGTDNGDGSWTLDSSEISGLSITPPLNSDDDFTLSVDISSSENGITVDSATQSFDIVVDPVADTPNLDVTSSVEGYSDNSVQINVPEAILDVVDTDSVVTIANVPSGAELSSGTDNGDGTWSVVGEDLDNLFFIPEEDSTDSVDLSFNFSQTDTQTLIDATFDSDAEGFTYSDDTFRGSSEPVYADGSFDNNAGDSGGGLQVELGGIDNNNIDDISGGFSIDFNVPDDATGSLTFSYRLDQATPFENNEFAEVLASVDGNLFGTDGNDYVDQVAGGGDTGWQTVTLDVGNLSAGTHTLTLGGYNNRKTFNNEDIQISFDDVSLTVDSVIDVTEEVTVTPSEIPLTIDSSLVDTDGSESLAGAILSAGVDNNDGTYSLNSSDLADLTIDPAPGFSGDFQLTVEAISTDGSDISSTSQIIDVSVHDVAVIANDNPVITTNVASDVVTSFDQFDLVVDPDGSTGSFGDNVTRGVFQPGGGTAQITVNSDGIGIDSDIGNDLAGQIDFDPTTGESEQVVLDFANPVENLQITLGRQFENEGGPGIDEQGIWTAFDVFGNELASGELDPDLGVSLGNGTFQYNLESDLPISKIVIEANDFSDSDFTLLDIQFNETTEVPLSEEDVIDVNITSNIVNNSVVADVNASDPNGDALTYSIVSGNDDGAFVIDSATGVVTIADENAINPQVEATRSLEVRVEDGLGGGDNAELNISFDAIVGTDNSETINGTANSDAIFGEDGDDRLNGNAGDDYLNGGAGDDTLNAGSGDDRLIGGDGDDQLNAGTGDDQLNGGDGNDTLNGGDGNDVLNGGAGDDTLNGGTGDDTLNGGIGNDQLNGGDGSDLFIFSEGSGQDVVSGGSGGWTDVIELDVDIDSQSDPDNPWTITVDGDEVSYDVEQGFLDLGSDASGIISFDDGSEITFDGVEQIQW